MVNVIFAWHSELLKNKTPGRWERPVLTPAPGQPAPGEAQATRDFGLENWILLWCQDFLRSELPRIIIPRLEKSQKILPASDAVIRLALLLPGHEADDGALQAFDPLREFRSPQLTSRRTPGFRTPSPPAGFRMSADVSADARLRTESPLPPSGDRFEFPVWHRPQGDFRSALDARGMNFSD